MSSLDISVVDRALTNLFGVLMDLEYFEGDGQLNTGTDSLDVQDKSQKRYHDQLALEAGLQSIVLLKNGSPQSQPNQPLPLSQTEHTKITLIGPLADDKWRCWEIIMAYLHLTMA